MCTQSTPTTCTARESALTIVVPVYNNAGSLPLLHERLLTTLRSLGSTFEIIYVNDGSSDASLELLGGLRAGGEVRVVDLSQNFGQSAAVLAAFSIATGEIVVTIDADLENRPEDIPALVAAVRDGADLACGVRTRRSAPLLTRKGPSLIANRLVGRAFNVNLHDWGCGLNATTREIVQQILAQIPLPSLPKIEAALLSSRISQVPVSCSEREHGKSGYTVRRLGGFAATFLRGFSISRTLRRLPGIATARSDLPVARRVVDAFAGLLSWLILTIAALIVRAWTYLSGSASNTERFRIREILD